MKSDLRKCDRCNIYTLDSICPKCLSATVCPIPMKYSPEDRYGEYRRKSIREEYGENGKHHKI